MRGLWRQGRDEGGATLIEFAFTLPIVVAILYGIFDFGTALTLKEKLEHVVYEGARTAASQSPDDFSNVNVATAGSVSDLRDSVARNLRDAGVNDCGLMGAATSSADATAAVWVYTVSGNGCPGTAVLTIHRQDVVVVGVVDVFTSSVTLQYPFQYHLAGILRILTPTGGFPAATNLVVSANMKNLM